MLPLARFMTDHANTTVTVVLNPPCFSWWGTASLPMMLTKDRCDVNALWLRSPALCATGGYIIGILLLLYSLNV